VSANPKDALGVKKPDLSLIPPTALVYLAKALEEGARKYGPYNWRQHPVKYRVYIAAALRHIACALDREDLDPENPDKPHLAGAMASLAILADAIETGNVIDDRPMPGVVSGLLAARSVAPEAAADAVAAERPVFTTQYECVPPARAAWDGTIWPCPDCSAELHGRDAYEQHRWKAHPSQRPLHTGEPAAVSSEHDAVASALDTLEGRRNARPCTCFWPAYSNSQCPIPGHPLPMRERRHQ